MQAEKIILGIDPGTNVMGYGAIRCRGNHVDLVTMGVIDMRKTSDPYLRLGHIYERVSGIIAEYLPDELAIEAPFFGKNVQSMLKLGRAQGVAIASAIQQTAPVFVLIYVIIKERRKPFPAELGALVLVITGSFLIATHGDFRALAVHPLALLFGLISALMCALYITLPSELIRRYGTFETVGWGLFIGGIVVAPLCRLWNFPAQWDATLIAGMIFIILPGAACAFALFLYGTSIVGPVRGGVYNLFEPVTALVASVLLLNQSFHPTEIGGTIAILAGIAILTVAKEKTD